MLYKVQVAGGHGQLIECGNDGQITAGSWINAVSEGGVQGMLIEGNWITTTPNYCPEHDSLKLYQ